MNNARLMNRFAVRAGVLAAATVFTASAWAGQARVVNADAEGIGFNNTTPREPVGGNGGTTLGEQRLRATRFAANLLASKVASEVTLVVNAQADTDMACSNRSATLASAGPTLIYSNFNGAPMQDTVYPIGLVNAITGEDLVPDENPRDTPSSDIRLRFNPYVGQNNDCLGGRDFYYGLDGQTPDNTINFVNIITHEMTHGLGFTSSADPFSGAFTSRGFPSVFDLNIQDLDQEASWAESTPSQRAMSATNTGRLVFVGESTDTSGAAELSAGLAEGHVRLFAPERVDDGSSVAHWAPEVSPDQIMEPVNPGGLDATQGVGLTSCALDDIGWTLEEDVPCPDDTIYAPALVGVPSSLSFDAVSIDDKKALDVQIRNRGGNAITIDNVTAEGRAFMITDNRCSAPIDAQDTCTIEVTFNPTTTGQKSTTLEAMYDGTILPIALSGKATEGSGDAGDSGNAGASGGDDDGGSSGGGCTMATTSQPFDPMWLVLLAGALGTLLFRARGAQPQ